MISRLVACALFGCWLPVGGALAQHAPGYSPPRTSWGAPDLQGFWNSTSITSLQRPAGVEKLVVSEAEGRTIVNDNPLIIITQQESEAQGSDPNDTSILNDKNADRGYNAFWIDPGTKLADVKGEIRTSWIVDPPNGRIPFKLGAGRAGAQHSPANFDDPETRPLFERCIMTESMAGPVMQNAMYNSTLQVVQAPAVAAEDSQRRHGVGLRVVHHARQAARLGREDAQPAVVPP